MKLPKLSRMIAAGALLLIALGFFLAAALLPRPLQSQRQAERWAGESGARYRQFTCVLSPGQTLEPETILGFREKAAGKIDESDFDAPAGGAAICDAWSVGGTLKVHGARGNADAAALAVGGRFFDFHPLTLRSGGYLAESDLMKDRVVLDEQLAWMLYGSANLAGMTVQIGDREFLIAGVVAQADDLATRAVSELSPTIYLDYNARELLSGSGVSCYETVLPEPVEGFGRGIAEEAFGKLGVVVENTGRFSFASSLRQLRALGMLGTRSAAVAYPSWENAAVYTGTLCALLRGAGMLCAVYPAVLLLVMLRRALRFAFRKLKGGGAAVWEAALDRRDELRRKRAGLRK